MNNELTNLSESLIDNNEEMMEKIAKNEQSFNEIRELTSDKVTDQFKVFLIARARNELGRIVKLTSYLDRIESNYMNKVDEAMTNDELTLRQYEGVINTITGLLARSSEIIAKVLNDDKLTTILNTTIYTSDKKDPSSIVSKVSDPRSREKIRNIINQVIVTIDDMSGDINDEDLVEIKAESEAIDDE